MSNILNHEFKARCFSLDKIREQLKSLDARFVGVDNQTDTYFNTNQGRLKLREGNVENNLIYYERENDKSAKSSFISLYKVVPESNLGDILEKSNGIKVQVKKKREIYFVENVKIHLDMVYGLGNFVEVEAISENGEFSVEKLKDQCEQFQKLFEIKEKDFISLSYSDLLLEDFEDRIFREALEFVSHIEMEMQEKGLDFKLSAVDHLCYRVATVDEYGQYCQQFKEFSDLLVESEVGGRMISSFKLHEPIQIDEHEIAVIELPSPKNNNKYATGFEHAEFVIAESFEEVKSQYSQVDFDESGSHKEINPELRIPLASGASIKLHHQSLESVIEYEKSMV